MTFEEFWRIVEEKNSQIQSGKISMSSENFKKALQLAWNQGMKDQQELDKTWMDMMRAGSGTNSKDAGNFGDIFGQMFRGNK